MCRHSWLKCNGCGTVFRGPEDEPGQSFRCRRYGNDPRGDNHRTWPPENSRSSPVPIHSYYHPECKNPEPDLPQSSPRPFRSYKPKIEEQHTTYRERAKLRDRKEADKSLEREERLALAEVVDEGRRAKIEAEYAERRARAQKQREARTQRRAREEAAATRTSIPEREEDSARITLPGTAFTRAQTAEERADSRAQRRRRERSLIPLASRRGSEERRMIRTRHRDERIETCGSDGLEAGSCVGTWSVAVCTQPNLASRRHCVYWQEHQVFSRLVPLLAYSTHQGFSISA